MLNIEYQSPECQTSHGRIAFKLQTSKFTIFILLLLGILTGCSHPADPNMVTMVIESSPANLDPRVGTDGPSERIDELIFDALLRRDEHFNVQPGLAVKWETPDPLTYVFHLRPGVHFHDGRALTSTDVKWTFDSILKGWLRTPKTGTYQSVASVEAPDPTTVIFRLKQPNVSLPWNLSEGAIGIIPAGSGPDFNRKLVGSGPFRFVSQEQDKEVVLERNPNYWDAKPNIERVRFIVVPDATTRLLELRKGSADIALNAFTADAVETVRRRGELDVQQGPGTIYSYIGMNLRDPILKDVRVRQAIAHAIDREALVKYLWRDEAQLADSLLPPQSWAHTDAGRHTYDPTRARALLDEAGYRSGAGGTRFHLTMKTSTEESTRLMAAVLQQQLREVGIALEIKTFESATFLSDITKGEFQIYSLRWIGGNEDPDMFDLVFNSARTPPKGANRGFYSNPRVDALIAQGRSETDQGKRKQTYAELQKIVADDLPYINLWWGDNVLVHSKRLADVELSPSGDYNFLKDAHLQH
jgi:peptide/nickel transport system substrate-binding protein